MYQWFLYFFIYLSFSACACGLAAFFGGFYLHTQPVFLFRFCLSFIIFYWYLCFFFAVAAQYLTCARHINFIAFSFDYIMLFRANYYYMIFLVFFAQIQYVCSQLQHSFIVTLLKKCYILKWSSIYSNTCKAATSKGVYKLGNLVNLVKNMSFHEVNIATDIDQQTER